MVTIGPSVVLGNLDGVHRGHQALLAEAHRPIGGKVPEVVVLTFEPHPVEFFAPKMGFRRIFSVADQKRILHQFRVAQIIHERFDDNLSALSATDFLEERIWRPLHPSRIVVGFNFRFGRGRSGGPDELRLWGQGKNVEIVIVEPLKLAGETVSSSHIRQHLQHGEVMQAARLLGFPFFIRGAIEAGAQRGKAMGFPTANLSCPSTLVPKHGVYVTRVLVDAKFFEGVSHLGPIPTFSDPRPRLETFLLNFDGEIYNQEIQVEFLEWIREIRKFEDADSLKEQITKDISRAREVHDEFIKVGIEDSKSQSGI